MQGRDCNHTATAKEAVRECGLQSDWKWRYLLRFWKPLPYQGGTECSMKNGLRLGRGKSVYEERSNLLVGWHICILGWVSELGTWELGTQWVTWLCVLCRLEEPHHCSDPWSPGYALEFLGLAISPTPELPSLLHVFMCTHSGKRGNKHPGTYCCLYLETGHCWYLQICWRIKGFP